VGRVWAVGGVWLPGGRVDALFVSGGSWRQLDVSPLVCVVGGGGGIALFIDDVHNLVGGVGGVNFALVWGVRLGPCHPGSRACIVARL
jgi:hypothetical protein